MPLPAIDDAAITSHAMMLAAVAMIISHLRHYAAHHTLLPCLFCVTLMLLMLIAIYAYAASTAYTGIIADFRCLSFASMPPLLLFSRCR